jgi:hypothetical protein
VIKPRGNEIGGVRRTNGTHENTYILVGKPGEKRPLERLGSRWVSNTEIDIKQLNCESVECIYLTEVREQQQIL